MNPLTNCYHITTEGQRVVNIRNSILAVHSEKSSFFSPSGKTSTTNFDC
jgi:hypothetical protein